MLPMRIDADTLPVKALAKTDGHKFAYGHALVFSGDAGRTGAARLAARAALRIGAGLVTMAVPPAAQLEVAAQVTAVMMRRIDDAEALRILLTDKRFNALCLGPGLGLEPSHAALVNTALEADRATLLDADALTLIGRDAELFGKLHPRCVLTPHEGEFARLFPDLAEALSTGADGESGRNRANIVSKAAARAGCCILLKGADTAIADGAGRCALHAATGTRAAPWLATAGSGDVLAGFITGLLARGSAPFEAACAAAWLHVECARSFGPGLISEDLPEVLPKVLQKLLGANA
jgi:hydroxyethylthiazole kinase-like uncharacterized protein yjeF